MELYTIIEPYLSNGFSVIVGGFGTWFFQRKISKVNLEKGIVDLYQDSLTDLKNRYAEKYADMKETYDNKLQNVLSDVELLKSNVEDWKKKYYDLKRDFEKYKKEHP